MNAVVSLVQVKFLVDLLALSDAVLARPLDAKSHLPELTRLETVLGREGLAGVERILLDALSDIACTPASMAELYRLGRIASEAHALLRDRLERITRHRVAA
ncbi:hypothetical protein [Bradyrhizobium sp. SZCCHNS2015]|uniref:hypothetical protein n=1 Tax=Bradyrhizobium sp. SZCCHNS2015 TaxID=3057305 RepID=UPI0028E57E1C|nr:hypothetical protein [Bradyrhizobium sp. SZCCHNS2015]